MEVKKIVNFKDDVITGIVKKLFGCDNGFYYEYEIDDKKKILHRIDNVFTVFYREDKGIVLFQFDVNEDYSLRCFAFEDYYLYFDGNSRIFQEVDTDNTHEIEFTDIEDTNVSNGYNQMIVYTQNNLETDSRLYMTYKIMKRSENKLYDFKLKDPFMIYFVDKVRKRDDGKLVLRKEKQFIRKDYDVNNLSDYNLQVLKEQGLLKFLFKNSYELQKDKSFSRYYKFSYTNKNHEAVVMPFSYSFTKEEVDSLLDKYDLKKSIPSDIISKYNLMVDLEKELCDLAGTMKEVENVAILKR